MKKVFCICLLATLSIAGWAQQEGTRILSLAQDWPNTLSIDVSISIDGEQGTVTVVERPPEGWEISSVQSRGVVENGVVTWNTSVRRTGLTQTVKYKLTLPSNDAVGVFQGTVNGEEIQGVQSFKANGVNPGVQTPVDSGLYYNYLVYLPPSYSESNALYPLLLFLHGAGERGDNINLVKVHGPPKIVENPAMMKTSFDGEEFPFILVSPQCPSGWWWEDGHVLDVLNEALENYPVDRNRVYMTGVSMGGFGSWSFASEHPDLIAAILPIAGGGDVFSFSIRSYTSHVDDLKVAKAEGLVDVPIWSFHGDADSTVSINLDREIVDRVNALGGDAKLTVYPGVGHDSWTQTYNNPEVFQWLLSNTKQGETQVREWMMYP